MNISSRRRFLSVCGLTLAATAPLTSAFAAQNSASKPLRILGIACSLRPGKSTAMALQAALDAAKQKFPQVETELIDLGSLKIPAGPAAGIALEPGERDDFPALAAKLANPAVGGFIVGSPVYMGSMTSVCKAFLERCIIFRKEWALRDKVVGALAVGGSANGGQDTTVLAILAGLMRQDVIVVGDGKPTGHPGATLRSEQDTVAKDTGGLDSARGLGCRVTELALRLAGR